MQPFDKENENPVQTFVGSKQKERILVEEAKWRKVILKFAKTEETKPIDRSLVHELKQQLPILRPLLKLATMENAQNNMVYCLAGFQEFICSLGTNSPVSAYIPLTGIPNTPMDWKFERIFPISENLESFPEREVQISPTDFGVFPCLPLVRGRGFYQADTKQLHDECRDDFDCKKLHKNLKSLTPWCIYPLL